jgi:RHS repeat-associated protein
MTLAHDNANRRTSLTLPNGIEVTYDYDDASQLTGLTYTLGTTTLGTLTYSYDLAGNRTAVGGTWARTNLPAALASATYDDANQIATWGATSFTYDDNGNLTSDGVRTYTWDVRNQLASLTGPVNGSFAYDGVGRRRSKTIGSTTTGFLYDRLNPVQELSGGSVLANLLTGLNLDEYFTRTDAGGVRNYLTDALGSSVALSDDSAVVQTEYTYDAFGGVTTSGGSSGSSFAFTGREVDGTGLTFHRARYYDPRLQRFISLDPLGTASGDVNLYAYTRNSPQMWADRLGLCVPVPPVIVSCIPPAVAVTGEILGWLAATYAAARAGQELAEALNEPVESSTLGGDDDAFSSDEAMDQAIRDTRKILDDPNSSAKDRSRAQKRLNELQRHKSKKAHGADKSGRGGNGGGKGGGSGRQGRGGGGKGGGSGRGAGGAFLPGGGDSHCMASKKC